MSGITKVFLLLAVMVCIAKAQLHSSGQQCLCGRVKKSIDSKSGVKDIQVYPATNFCDKVEIVVTNNNGLRYCLDPKLSIVKKLMASIMKKRNSATVRPTEVTSTSSSIDTARI